MFLLGQLRTLACGQSNRFSKHRPLFGDWLAAKTSSMLRDGEQNLIFVNA